jgi:hypothetical protein
VNAVMNLRVLSPGNYLSLCYVMTVNDTTILPRHIMPSCQPTPLSEMSLFKLFVKFIKYVMFGVLTAVKSILRLCVMTQCGFVGCYRRFGKIIASILHAKDVPNIYIQRIVIRIR